MSGRLVRIFLSSTFRDFGEERDLLVRKVFPTLRAKLQPRFVDLVDVDLRWGITEEEAERGEVLPICLSEIDRARPYFIGFLGERYGWVPPPDAYPSHVLESQSWLEEHRGGKSVTELEILHGVLNNPHMEGRALFYFRSFEYSSSKGGDYIASSPTDEASQSALKETIRKSGFPVYEDYKSPEHLAELLEQDLWEILDREFPASDIPDGFVRENLQHEAYALPRQRLYIGGGQYLAALDKALSEEKQWILVDGPSGGGKSALLANWLQLVRDRDKNIEVHAHYLGATADATDPISLIRRLIECIKRKIKSRDDLASDPDELLDSLPIWLANASSWCELQGKKFLFVIDALNNLSDRCDLRWFPRMLPKHIHLVISTLPGEVGDALQAKANWSRVSVMPLDAWTAELVFTSYLAMFNKTLPDDLVAQVMAHELSVNPLFLLTLAEELRLFGKHEQLSSRLDHYLTSITVDDLFERVLERIEQDHGADTLCEIMTALWATRAGLREEEILGYSGLKPMHWAYIRNALGPTLIDASGRLIFAHDYMRIAVSDRYMAGNNTIGNEGQSEEALNLRQAAHKKLVKWFEKYAFKDGQTIISNERAAEEIPYQWQQAQDWKKLQSILTKQKMLIAILEHRSEQELLSYWLALKIKINSNIEIQYEKAWYEWIFDPEKEAALAQRVGWFLNYSGCQSFTEKLFQKSLNLFIGIYGAEHEYTSTAFTSLGNFLSKKGDYRDAEPLLRQALEVRKKIAPNHHYTADSYNNLASLLDDEGKFEEAEILYKHSLKIRENTFGLEHPATAQSLNNLGILYSNKGEYDAAEELLAQSLQIREKTLGPHHPDTAESLNNMASHLRDMGDYDAAEALFRRSLHIFESTLGPEHPLTALSLNNLGGVLSDKEDDDGAEYFLRYSLKIYEKSLGIEHPETVKTLENLAGCLLNKGDTSDAENLYAQSLKIKEKIFGLEHPETLKSINTLGELLYHNGDYSSAEILYRKCLGLRQKVLGQDHLDTAESLYNLANLLYDKGEFAASEPLLFKAEKIATQKLREDHLYMITSLLSTIFLEQKKYSKAEESFQKLLLAEQREFEANSFELALTYFNLGECQFHQAKFGDAEQNLHRALSLQTTQYSENDIELKQVLALLRDVSIALGKEAVAQDFSKRISRLDR